MITPSQVYWITRLDGLNNMFHTLSGLAMGVWIILTFAIALITININCASNRMYGWYDGETDEEMERAKNNARTIRQSLIRYCLPIAFACDFLFTSIVILLPTTKEMAAITIIPMMANSQAAQQLPDVATEFVSLAKDWLKELKPKSK